MTILNKVSNKSLMTGVTPIADVPDAPTIGTATDVGTSRAYNNGSATVAYTGAATGGAVTTFTATSTPGSFTATGASPITVTGLQSATSYTFAVSAANSSGTLTSASTSAITATTVPQAPTIGTFTDGGTGTTGTLTFTAGATGGKSITNYKYSTDSSTYTAFSPAQTTSPLSLTGLTPGTYNFSVKAVNANGDSAASSGVSGTVIQPTAFYNIATATGGSQTITFSSIPSTYKSLQIRMFVRSGAGSNAGNYANIGVQFNSDSGNNYAYHNIYTNGGVYTQAVASYSQINLVSSSMGDNITSGNFGATILDIIDYSNTSKNKTIRTFAGAKDEGGNVSNNILTSGLWLNTSAISSITLTHPGAGTFFDSNSTFALYGIN